MPSDFRYLFMVSGKHMELQQFYRGGSWIYALRIRRPSSHMTLVSMTTENMHKVFPAIRILPKRLVRGEYFKIHYIMEEFPL